MTVDVVTPMVDDARLFGAIAAANSLSDVYAMGGVPQVALSFVGFPTGELPLSTLSEVLAGMQEVCAEAGCAIVGGHTIIDNEPKAGLSVTGVVEEERVWSHRGGQAGQALVLTKALGTGVAVAAMKRGDAPTDLALAAQKSMRRLNREACEAGRKRSVTAATDVTGFGLLGHLKNLCEASSVSAEINVGAVPLLPGALALAELGQVPGGSKRNWSWVAPLVEADANVTEAEQLLLADAQTSGGLLLALPPEEAESLVAELVASGHAAALIGRLLPAQEKLLLLRR